MGNCCPMELFSMFCRVWMVCVYLNLDNANDQHWRTTERSTMNQQWPSQIEWQGNIGQGCCCASWPACDKKRISGKSNMVGKCLANDGDGGKTNTKDKQNLRIAYTTYVEASDKYRRKKLSTPPHTSQYLNRPTTCTCWPKKTAD